MFNLDRRLPQVDANRYSMIERPDIPRSTFINTKAHKTTFNAGLLIPIYCDEVLPGDVHKGNLTIFARLSTLVFPLMDNLCLETFFFYVPNRIVWQNWRKLMGEQDNPADSISFTIPTVTSAAGGFPILSIYDYFGLPCVGQTLGGNTITVNSLPLRAYNLIYHEWFRDEDIQTATFVRNSSQDGNGPDAVGGFNLLNRNKKKDYFTACRPWPLKGGQQVSYLTGSANVLGLGAFGTNTPQAGNPASTTQTGGVTATGWAGYYTSSTVAQAFAMRAAGTGAGSSPVVTADLTTVTGATINALRLAFQTQRLLERDARGGTRYTEILRSHFGVTPQDSRLQRPEYIGGGRTDFQTSAIPQTSATGLTGGNSPLGALGATSIVAGTHSFACHCPEHGYIIGLANVDAPQTYQNGLPKMWTRSTRYDFYWPVFAFLGEQAVLNSELYSDGSANDALVFGYQERWAEYRHMPNSLTGLFRSRSAGAIDGWHAAINYSSLPALNATFINQSPPMTRILAAGGAANGAQIIYDSVIHVQRTRQMPTFSTPGNLDRF